MSLSLPKCVSCKHYYYDEKNQKMCCKAFSTGIPILDIEENRETECKDGIKFEKKEKHPS